jgi:hypothetical protein
MVVTLGDVAVAVVATVTTPPTTMATEAMTKTAPWRAKRRIPMGKR